MEVDEPIQSDGNALTAVEQIGIRPNRDLLNPNFDKYILSTQDIPLIKKVLDQKINVSEPSNVQWSRHELKLFNLVNPVVLDLLHSTNVSSSFVFLSSENNIIRLNYNHNNSTFGECQTIPLNPPLCRQDKSVENSLPVSLLIGSSENVFISDGCGNLYVYKMDIIDSAEEWKMVAGFTLKPDHYELQQTCNDTGVPFIIADVRQVNESRFEIALLSVFKQNEETRDGGSVYANAIHLISVELSDKCKIVHTRCYHATKNLEFVTISSTGDELILLTEKEPQIVFDSKKEIVPKNSTDADNAAPPHYTWSQSHDEVVISFVLNGLTAKEDIKVAFQSNSLSISNKNSKLLEGNLFAEIIVDESTWTFQKVNDNIAITFLLEVTLHKKIPTAWLQLVPTDHHGQEKVNVEDADMKSLHEQVAPTSVNPDQLEEVDEDENEIHFLFWINGNQQRVTRMANLSFHKLIFAQKFHPNQPLDICIREDVDGVVYSLDNINKSKLEHNLTLDAFGYIQVSKASRRFSTCSPDGSFSAIVDGRNHAYIYLKSCVVSDTELRNTKTRKNVQTVARQHVISLASCDPEYGNNSHNQNIIFAFAREKILFLATDRAIYACHVY